MSHDPQLGHSALPSCKKLRSFSWRGHVPGGTWSSFAKGKGGERVIGHSRWPPCRPFPTPTQHAASPSLLITSRTSRRCTGLSARSSVGPKGQVPINPKVKELTPACAHLTGFRSLGPWGGFFGDKNGLRNLLGFWFISFQSDLCASNHSQRPYLISFHAGSLTCIPPQPQLKGSPLGPFETRGLGVSPALHMRLAPSAGQEVVDGAAAGWHGWDCRHAWLLVLLDIYLEEEFLDHLITLCLTL